MGVMPVKSPNSSKISGHVTRRRLHLYIVKSLRPVSSDCKHGNIFYTVGRASTPNCYVLLERVGVCCGRVESGTPGSTVTGSLSFMSSRA